MQHITGHAAKRSILFRMKQYAVSCGQTLAPSFVFLAITATAHAQGTIDFSGSTTWLNSVKTFAIYAGAVIAFIALIFTAIKFAGRDIPGAVMGLGGILFGAGVLGWGAGWISSLTGQAVQ